MKRGIKVFVAIAALGAGLLSGNNSFAQTAAPISASATATLKVTLANVMTIAVSSASQTITLPFSTALDYASGVNATAADHLEVTSTTGFQVSVKSNGPLTNGTENIAINTIKLKASQGSAGTTAVPTVFPAVTTYPEVAALSTSDQPLISSGGTTGGTPHAFYNVKYTSTGGAEYVNKPIGDYTATVTYTIAAL